jgi:hypothetical protein
MALPEIANYAKVKQILVGQLYPQKNTSDIIAG